MRENGWPAIFFVCSPSGRGAGVAVDAAVLVDLASSFAKFVFVLAVGGVAADGVPPVVAAEAAPGGPVIGPVVGIRRPILEPFRLLTHARPQGSGRSADHSADASLISTSAPVRRARLARAARGARKRGGPVGDCR